MPTALPMPWPSGPVVVSTPAVWPYSGCPGVLLRHVRRALRSPSSSPQPPRNSWMYSVRLEWPQLSTNRSRPGQCGSAGLWRITFWNSRYAAGARLIAVPGWPLTTFCTESIASTRTVSTAWSSCSVQSSFAGELLTLFSFRNVSDAALVGHRLRRLRDYSPRGIDCEARPASRLLVPEEVRDIRRPPSPGTLRVGPPSDDRSGL